MNLIFFFGQEFLNMDFVGVLNKKSFIYLILLQKRMLKKKIKETKKEIESSSNKSRDVKKS